jgi:hypothetical protein
MKSKLYHNTICCLFKQYLKLRKNILILISIRKFDKIPITSVSSGKLVGCLYLNRTDSGFGLVCF